MKHAKHTLLNKISLSVIFNIALRNVKRRKLQSFIIIISLLTTSFLITTLRSIQNGSFDSIVYNTTSSYLGYATISKTSYKDVNDFKETMSEKLINTNRISKIGNTEYAITKRAIGSAIVQVDDNTVAARIIGINPEEKLVTNWVSSLQSGKYLNFNKWNSNEAMIGKSMAKVLNVSVGDELIMMSSAKSSGFVIEPLKIVGILSTGDQAVDKFSVIIPYRTFNTLLLDNDNSYHTIALQQLGTANKIPDKVIDIIQKRLPPHVKIYKWYEKEKTLKDIIALDYLISSVFFYTLIVIVVLAITNSIVISTLNRMREFGILISIGFKVKNISQMLFFEIFILSTIGIALGGAIAIAYSYYLQGVGIDLSSFYSSEVLDSAQSLELNLASIIYPNPLSIRVISSTVILYLLSLLSFIPIFIRIKSKSPSKLMRRS